MILLLADWKEGAQISERVRALASQILSVGKGLGAALQPFNSLKTQVGAKPLAYGGTSFSPAELPLTS